jgi:hypothetical protein
MAAVEQDIDLDRGIAAGIEDFAGANVGDGVHVGYRSGCEVLWWWPAAGKRSANVSVLKEIVKAMARVFYGDPRRGAAADRR